jgi:rSAM/selenodomain-associated transferase 1
MLMAKHGAIAVFVKTPGLSPVKTRLAKTLGTENAEAFHLAAAKAVSAVVQNTALHGYYAVAEATALTFGNWQNMPQLWQGEGGLGERMAHIYNRLLQQYTFVILVGADSPQMTANHLLAASNWLADKGQARFAFGSSFDGGFWLFGGNRHIPPACWTEVTYSVADTGAQFLHNIQPLGEVQTMTTLHDVDEPPDLMLLHAALQDLSAPVPEQIELRQFLEALLRPDF